MKNLVITNAVRPKVLATVVFNIANHWWNVANCLVQTEGEAKIDICAEAIWAGQRQRCRTRAF